MLFATLLILALHNAFRDDSRKGERPGPSAC